MNTLRHAQTAEENAAMDETISSAKHLSFQPDPIAEEMSVNPDAVMALFKVQAIYRQRKLDEDKPKETVFIEKMTREQAQRIADELCQYVRWGGEWIEPKINA